MIAVIADDFTGAAEVGGVALRHGLKVVIETDVEMAEDADLLIVATNTRSLPANEAIDVIKRITTQLLRLKPSCIFKKLDSVLRGNIVCELEAQLETMELERSVVIAGNPYFGRVIIDGEYFVNGVPLSETFFAQDPEFPLASSSVKTIVERNDQSVETLSLNDTLPSSGIVFGNVASVEELNQWALQLDNSTMMAGGAGFLNALLEKKFPEVSSSNEVTYELTPKSLFVFGSAFPKSKVFVDYLLSNGLIFVHMPQEIYFNKDFRSEVMIAWADEVITLLQNDIKVVVDITYMGSEEENISLRIQQNVAELVRLVNKKVDITDLLIEGGATTYEILKALNISTLYPFQELDAGVIQMHAKGYQNLCITTKPGSYYWPENILINRS